MEARTGVALFPAVFVPGRPGGGLALLWQEIDALPEPAAMPDLELPNPAAIMPSPRIQAAARQMRNRAMLAVSVLVAGAALVIAAAPSALLLPLLAAIAVVAAGLWWLRRPAEVAAARAQLLDVRRLWAELVRDWGPGPAARFAATRQSLAALKREHDGLAKQREAELHGLAANRQQQQFRTHLESFEIANAKIAGIGKAKVATLLSYGVETAADIDQKRIEAIPGFGPRTAANMLAFRQTCEASFHFDPNRTVTSAQVAAMDGMLAQRRTKIEAELAAGLTQLKAMLKAEQRHRADLSARAAELRPMYAQALADARAVRVDHR